MEDAAEGFDSSRQMRRLFIRSLVRLVVTMVLAFTEGAVLFVYSTPAAITTAERQQFNALILAVSIALGLNIASSLKSNVSHLRWWLFSLRERSPQEADLILQIEEIGRLAKLGLTTRRLSVRFFVMVWISFHLVSQVAVALLGLTYNTNDSTNFLVTQPGLVLLRNMTDIQNEYSLSELSDSQSLLVLRHVANSFGKMSISSRVKFHDSTEPLETKLPRPGAKINVDNHPIFCEGDTTTCRFVFAEDSAASQTELTVATKRHVSATTTCQSWRVSSGGNGLEKSITLADGSNTTVGPIPALNGPNQNLFMFNPNNPRSSGDSWAIITVLEASDVRPRFYSCNVTLGPVVNAKLREHQLETTVRRLSTQAIALQGYGTSTAGTTNSTDTMQFQSYPVNDFYGVKARGDVRQMGLQISMFCIGALGGLSLNSPLVEVPGMAPIQSASIQVFDWNYVYMILGFTVGFQTLVSIASITVGSRVQINSRSHLAMATLLQPVTQDLGKAVYTADERHIAKLMGPRAKLAYVPDELGAYHIVKSAG